MHPRCPNDHSLTLTLSSHIPTCAQITIKHSLNNPHACPASKHNMHIFCAQFSTQLRLHARLNGSNYAQNTPKTSQISTECRFKSIHSTYAFIFFHRIAHFPFSFVFQHLLPSLPFSFQGPSLGQLVLVVPSPPVGQSL